MSNIKSNYGIEKKSKNTSSSVLSAEDAELEMLKHVGGSFVYVKTKKFTDLE